MNFLFRTPDRLKRVINFQVKMKATLVNDEIDLKFETSENVVCTYNVIASITSAIEGFIMNMNPERIEEVDEAVTKLFREQMLLGNVYFEDERDDFDVDLTEYIVWASDGNVEKIEEVVN